MKDKTKHEESLLTMSLKNPSSFIKAVTVHAAFFVVIIFDYITYT